MIDIGNGHLSTLNQSKYKVDDVNLKMDQITQISETIFQCENVLADSWYRSLDQPDQILNVQDYVEERTQQQHQPQQQYDDDDQQPGTSGMAGSSAVDVDSVLMRTVHCPILAFTAMML